MKIILIILAASSVLLPSINHGAQTAQATLFCWSLRFQQGEDTNPFSDATLNLSTVSGTPNGELALWDYPFSFTHRSSFVLDLMGFPISGTIEVDVPLIADANDNGFDDNFEVSQGGSGTSDGEYFYPGGGHGIVVATWSRGAGSKDGTCRLYLEDDDFGPLGTFQHPFEVLEYKGPLTYTPGSNAVSGGVNLTNAAGQLQGPMNFTKSATDPYDELTLQGGFLTNDVQQTFSFDSSSFSRDLYLDTNYYGALELDSDANPSTFEPFGFWELSIDDHNDSDHDGIPDFSDTTQSVASPRRPLLSLARGSTNLLLSIAGDVGRRHQIQEAGSVTAPNWQTALSVTLTNDPQVVSLPLPADGLRFWRVEAQ